MSSMRPRERGRSELLLLVRDAARPPTTRRRSRLAAIEDRQALEDELGALLTDLPSGMGLLVVRRGPNAGSTYVLDREVTTVGRHPESDIFLDDVTVSRRHAVVRRVDGAYLVDDVGSLNGTYVDHRRIDSEALTDLAELQVGRYVLTFVLGGGGASPA